MRITTVLALTTMLGVATSAPAVAQTAADREGVRQAALDYVEGIYTVEASRIERSVHQDLAKRGFWRNPQDARYGPQSTMTFDQLVNLARTWNKDGKRDTSIKKVEVIDVLDQTAVAKVTASWGIDHMHLAKYDGRWKIINIVWQAHPPARTTAGK
jgi:hypothetical protein